MLISVVVTTYNERNNLPGLLDSLVLPQTGAFEVLIIDAGSTDGSQELVGEYKREHETVQLEVFPGTRGESRNRGIEMAAGDAIAFIDGDALAHPSWLKELRKSLKESDVVGGKIINFGYQPFVELGRVEVYYKGSDLSMPSCNLAFRREVLDTVGGFDPAFITAEDMDLNLRARKAGYSLTYNEKAVVYHHARSTVGSFFKQAFWNGVGRKQLEIKHGSIWEGYDMGELISRKTNLWYYIRMAVAMMGYVACTITTEDKYRPGAEG